MPAARSALAATCLATVLLAGAVSCKEERVGGTPVLLVGIDGLDPGVTAELLAAGRLPNLARFAEEGVLVSLESMRPTYSPVLWTTIATGQLPREHGVTDFLEPQSGLPFTTDTRQVPALWNIVSDAGATVDVAGWWVSWPAEPVRGRVVASYAAQAQARVLWKSAFFARFDGMTHPPRLMDDITPLITFASDPEPLLEDLFRHFPAPDDFSPLSRQLVTDLAWTWSADRSFTAIGEHFLRDDPGRLVLVYLSLPDVAGHRFWRYHRPEDFPYPVDPDELRRFGDYLASSYEEVDRALGRLMEAAGPSYTVLVVSDHGMTFDPDTRRDPAAITSGHHRNAEAGVFGALGAPFAHRPAALTGGKHGGHLIGVAPLVLRLLGLPRPDHWPAVASENALEGLLDPTWAAAHPGRSASMPDERWRARHRRLPPRVPSDGANEAFLDALRKLGYLGRPVEDETR